MELKMCTNCGNFTWNNGLSPMPTLCVECHFDDGIDGPSNWVQKECSDNDT